MNRSEFERLTMDFLYADLSAGTDLISNPAGEGGQRELDEEMKNNQKEDDPKEDAEDPEEKAKKDKKKEKDKGKLSPKAELVKKILGDLARAKDPIRIDEYLEGLDKAEVKVLGNLLPLDATIKDKALVTALLDRHKDAGKQGASIEGIIDHVINLLEAKKLSNPALKYLMERVSMKVISESALRQLHEKLKGDASQAPQQEPQQPQQPQEGQENQEQGGQPTDTQQSDMTDYKTKRGMSIFEEIDKLYSEEDPETKTKLEVQFRKRCGQDKPQTETTRMEEIELRRLDSLLEGQIKEMQDDSFSDHMESLKDYLYSEEVQDQLNDTCFYEMEDGTTFLYSEEDDELFIKDPANNVFKYCRETDSLDLIGNDN